MAKPIKLKINVKLIDKAALFHAQSGAVYLDLVAFENRDGPGKYGDTHIVKQSFKEGEGPEKPPIIGNLTLPQREEYRNEHTSPKPPAKAPAKAAPQFREEDQDDSIPF